MDTQLGEHFSKIRKSKNIPVKHIIGTHISESQYHRFIKGQSEISFSKFLYLLDQINITIEEFSITVLNYKDPLKDGMHYIKDYFEKQDIVSLVRLQSDFRRKGYTTKKIKYMHLSYICSCLISKLDRDTEFSAKEDLSSLIKYLMGVENWGHYEVVLFNNTFFLYDLNSIQILFKNAIKLSTKYKIIYNNTLELTKLYSNLILFFLENKETDLAIDVINNLNQIDVNEESIFEKVLIKYWNLIKIYLSDNSPTTLKDIEKLLKFLTLLECFEIKNMLEEILNHINHLKQIPTP